MKEKVCVCVLATSAEGEEEKNKVEGKKREWKVDWELPGWENSEALESPFYMFDCGGVFGRLD